jgi:hypothetical protein
VIEVAGLSACRTLIWALSGALLTLSSIANAHGVTRPSPPAGCNTAESHQWDFWVGKWEVRPYGSDTVIAHSLIEKRYAGCALRENWMPVGHEIAGGGGSLSTYDPRLRKWLQTWVDSSGSRVDLQGGFAAGIMTIAGVWRDFRGVGQDALVRMRYERLRDGQVRQWADSSVDGGKSWKPSFDFRYRRVDEFPPFQ